ncbi:Fanconi anemia group D2 protein homolog [Maniola jurtina]|uniref:Fanconi anemia group D2 protein homolog n=1 Tax=Maniola jurtina TaxID=191418 RepID=UPI001E68BA18|nr:Fanconi anemia group D2 protein homolog [Maniola jurtina]
MRLKRTSQRTENEELSQRKRQKNIISDDYFSKVLQECGLEVHESPDACLTSQETVIIIRNLKKNLQKHSDYPSNVSEFYSNFQKRCQDSTDFKHYLFPNIVRKTSDSPESCAVSDSLVKILLSVPILQNKLIDFIFEKAIDLAADSKCGPWIQMILKCFSTLDNIVDSDKISVHLISLLDVASEHMVRLEIITAIPDIIGDQAHDNIAAEMSRILSEDHELIPAILDCLSYLCLSDEQYERLQKKTLNILMTIPKCNHFPNFVKFLLMPGRTSDNAYLEVVQGLRSALSWSTSIDKPEEIVSSQVLTATAIRNSIVSSKVIANAWLKTVSMCTLNTDHKPIDFAIMVILYSTSEERQKQLEGLIRKQIKSNILNEELLDEAFEKFRPIFKDYLKNLITLTNSLLEVKSEPVIQNFASHLYTLMFSKLEEFCQTIVAELLQLGLDSKQCVINILSILNKVASKDMSILKPQSVQMLKLLDRMDDMSLPEIRAVMNLLCGLAYSYENSVIRDDIHMIMRKELGSSNPTVKIQGILAGIHAVKYLMISKDGEENSIDSADDISYSSVNHLIEGDIRDAAQIIEAINNNTRQFPDMIAFFYDELCKMIQSTSYINKHFLHWITVAVTNDLEQNFIVNNYEHNTVEDLKLKIQYCLNSDSEVEEVIAINIAGMTLRGKDNVNILILSPLFQLVQTLHVRKYNGDLSQIDALLGCPVVMPIFDVDSIEDMSSNAISHILDCQIHCANWFREIINAFASQNDDVLKSKLFSRVAHLQKLENLISTILLKISFTYKPPTNISSLRNNGIAKNNNKKQNVKQKTQKKATNEESILPETIKSQSSVNNNKIVVKNKMGLVQNITFRPFTLSILNLLKHNLTEKEETGLNIENLPFILKCINCNLENVLISRIKKTTFLTKQDSSEAYDCTKAEQCARSINDIIPKIIDHLNFITSHLDKSLGDNEEANEEFLTSDNNSGYILSLEYIFNMFSTYFKWMGFKIQHKALLETSLRSIASLDSENSTFPQHLQLTVAKFFQRHEKYCVQLTTAVALLDVVGALQEHTSSSTVTKILRKMAQHFLSREWKTASGAAEKGLFFNQSIDNFLQLNLKNIEVSELKKSILLLINEVQDLKSRNSTLASFPSINKNNLHILYRNMGSALQESAKRFLNKGLTNLEHLDLWREVVFVLKCMSEMAKTLKIRNILIAFFKKSLPIIRLFVQLGIPIIELEFKGRTKNVQEILETLQQSTRFLQTLGRHFRAKKDKALLGKVPYMKQLLETLLYKVKAVLAANDCSDAFWMGILKNKNIDGEVIATQQSVEEDESAEDCDEQLPEDDSDDTDNEMLNPDSRSVSDIV